MEISIAKAKWLTSVLLRPLPHTEGEIDGNGKLKKEGNYIRWYPPSKNARLEYTVKLNIERKGGGYDALVTDNWAILRGEDLFPSFRAKKNKGVVGQTFVSFVLPEGWGSVNAGWQQLSDTKFMLGNDDRALPRPEGWLIAGDLGTRRDKLGDTDLVISAPKGHNFRQMEAMAFFGMIWPEFVDVFKKMPPNILITGASDPMWRGGLSSPTSFYVHADRPLVSENGTSTYVHELIHIITGIHAEDGYDWIVEGLAEFYSVELLYRAGAYTDDRREKIFEGLADWGKDVTSLIRGSSYGEYTARATVLMDELNDEIIQCSNGKHSIDAITAEIQENKSVNLDDLKSAFANVCEQPSSVLQSKLVGAQ